MSWKALQNKVFKAKATWCTTRSLLFYARFSEFKAGGVTAPISNGGVRALHMQNSSYALNFAEETESAPVVLAPRSNLFEH